MDISSLKEYLDKLNQNEISFDEHFFKKARNRPINEGMVRSFLSQTDKLEKIERGRGENRFKLWFKMSNKYSLVLIVEIKISKGLKVITAWNSNKKW